MNCAMIRIMIRLMINYMILCMTKAMIMTYDGQNDKQTTPSMTELAPESGKSWTGLAPRTAF